MLYQPVGGNFHCAKRRALIHQPRQLMLNIDCRTGGIFCRDHFPQQAVTNGAHYRAGFAKQLAPLCQQLGRRGFAVGARYAYKT